MLEAGRYFSPNTEDEHALVDIAVNSLGLTAHHDFDPDRHIIEWALRSEVNV